VRHGSQIVTDKTLIFDDLGHLFKSVRRFNRSRDRPLIKKVARESKQCTLAYRKMSTIVNKTVNVVRLEQERLEQERKIKFMEETIKLEA